jgi:hypothetical protein
MGKKNIGVFVRVIVLKAGWVRMASSCVLRNKIRRIDTHVATML